MRWCRRHRLLVLPFLAAGIRYTRQVLAQREEHVLAINSQYSDPGPLFGGAADYANTGAPGSASPVTDEPSGSGGGGVIGNPVVSVPGASSQVAASMPVVPVTAGDTSSFSDDMPVHKSELFPADPSAYMSTGAGMGTDTTAGHHPNAGR
jgi:hypothetical protein